MKTITIWLTKYALTAGVTKHEVEHNPGNAYVAFSIGNALGRKNFKIGIDAHFSLEAAMWHAEDMRMKALIACENRMAKLKNLVIKYP